MNLRNAILVMLLIAFRVCVAQPTNVVTTEKAFDKGVDAFRNGDYVESSRAFRESLQEQTAAGTLLNLGISEWRRGRSGAAILAWEQALWISPFNKAARGNLDFAREVAQIEAPRLAWHETVSTRLPANTWAWLTALSVWLVAAMLILPRVLRWRKAAWHQSVAAIGLGMLLLSAPANIGIASRTKLGFILHKNTPLLLTPTGNAETITTLAAGEPARLIRTRGEFVLIHAQTAKGWVTKRQFGLIRLVLD